MTEFGKTVTATAISVLAHVTLFTALALMPEPVPVPEEPADPALEVTLHVEDARPEAVSPEASAVPEPVFPPEAQAIRTQIDPENLKKAERPPEHPSDVAAHDSAASRARPETAPSPETASSPAENGEPALQPVETPASDPGDAPGVDALGHYGKAVGNAIGVRSEYYRQARKHELAVGEVKLRFAVDAQGAVSDIRVVSNSAQPANATYAVKAVREAKIPPIPPERLAQLPGGRIEIVYTFTIYPTQ